MTDSLRPSSVKARYAVEVEHEPESLARRIQELAEMRPSGNVVLLTPLGFAYKREPDVFSAIASGASLGMGIMLAELTAQIGYFSIVGRVASGFFLLVGPLLFTRFLVNAFTAWEVTSSDGKLVSETTLAGRTRRRTVIDADQIVSVVVVEDEQRRARVAVGGPRHELLAELYVTRALDPDKLAAFLAEMVSLVARHASARRGQQR